MTDKPKAVRCVCKFFPLNCPGRKIQCRTKGCLFEGWKFNTLEDYQYFHEVRVVTAAVNVCRELGLINNERRENGR